MSSCCPPHTDNCTPIVNNSRKVYPYRYRHGISSDAPGCDRSALRRGAVCVLFDGVLRSPCVLRLLCASCRAWSMCAVHSFASDLRLSRCRGSWARSAPVLVSVRLSASAVVRLLLSVAHGVPSLCRQLCGAWWASCAVSALTVGKVSGSRSADHLGGASSLHGFSVLSSISIHGASILSSIGPLSIPI